MKSIGTRLDPIKDEVLDFTDKWGRWEAMREYGVHTLFSFERWLKERTGDEDFGKYPRFSGCPENIFEVVRGKIKNYKERTDKKIAEMVARNERLETENRMLRQALYKRFGQMMMNMIEELDR